MQQQGADSLDGIRPSEDRAVLPTPPEGAARGIGLALLISAPVWCAVGLGIWALTRP